MRIIYKFASIGKKKCLKHMEAYHGVLKSEGHMSPLLVAITHLNNLFMQNNLVAMVTVKHVSMCAEIFSDT